mmetsp:Transcript_59036/g.141005  ORF Transcript_59036/g.141005 Transcript_59036/m.141005 type:complete len:129 (+) Transcript_59036:88-474(+)
MVGLRKATSTGLRLVNRFSNCVPVLCRDAQQNQLLVVPGTVSGSDFKKDFFKSLLSTTPQRSTKAILVVADPKKSELPSQPVEDFSSMAELYDLHKADDGFLHVAYKAHTSRGGWGKMRGRRQHFAAL